LAHAQVLARRAVWFLDGEADLVKQTNLGAVPGDKSVICSIYIYIYQWIGLRENLQENPMIFMGKSDWFPVKIFKKKNNPIKNGMEKIEKVDESG